MSFSDWLFWNVDTQKDFVSPKGKLYVKDAEKLRTKWGILTQLAKEKIIRVINTADYHYFNSAELDSNPDYIHTFPQHCMSNSRGAEFVKETRPQEPIIFNWNKEYLITPEVLDINSNRNFVIRKDMFDVFAGNPWTSKILDLLSPKTVIVYGVTTNVCVDAAVNGLVSRVENVIVIKDAIKELPNIPLPFKNWQKLGVKLIYLDELIEMMSS